MRFLYNLISGTPGIYIVPATGLMQKLPPWELFADSVKTISASAQIDPDSLLAALVATGYESASLVTRVGEFSRRGGIVDFFSPLHQNPVRMEFFGDSIESMREFDVETQRSIGQIREAVVLPVRELIIDQKGIERFEKRLRLTTDEHGFAQKPNERVIARSDSDEAISENEIPRGVYPERKDEILRSAQNDSARRAQNDAAGISSREDIISQINQGIVPPGAEFLAPFFYEMESLFRYLPEDSLIALIEPDDLKKVIEEQTAKIEAGRKEETEEGRLLPEVSEMYLDSQKIESTLSTFPIVNLRLLAVAQESLRMDTKSAAWLNVRLTRSLEKEQHTDTTGEGSMARLVEKIKTLRESNRVSLVCGTDEAAVRIKKLLLEYGLGVILGSTISDEKTGPWPVTVMIGRISEGFSWPDLGMIFITEEEIFGRKVHLPPAQKKKVAPFLSSFKELKPGDFVVHADYGVGEYHGLTHISLDGIETDFLALRYEPDAKLYVPLYSLDKVQKYIGVEGSSPKLDRLGAPAWAKTKEKARKDILEMARELVKIYAAREAMQRVPFSAPDNLYREFESTFPYEETPDQEKVIEDILADMQRPRPMDRLVCGDVGFGKTEVALRAAFKAIEDGMQVAVLVPTTLLADQHYRTFSERLGPFSAQVEMLSRFPTKAEQRKTLAGVRDKERIKEFKKLVDVLTLTATPIPRTLHMSLAGIRDLSIIQTPPLDRQTIQVVLARFGPRVIREAITHELGRGGQVFFVQNRVQGIERMADFVQRLAPAARVGVAHGQMKEDEIEEVMSKFIGGGLNVLVTTSIIESGIDIPRANTIIINRADRFGLAELYQIKGRVGRSREKAYAYLLTPEEETLSDVSRTT